MAFDPYRFSKPQKHDLELMRQEKAAAKRARRLAKRQAAVADVVFRREYPTADDRVFEDVEVGPAIELFDPVPSPEFIVERAGTYRIVRQPGKIKLTRDDAL